VVAISDVIVICGRRTSRQ